MDRDAEKADRQDQTPPGYVGDEPVEDAEPGGQDGVYDQEADRDGRQPPPNS